MRAQALFALSAVALAIPASAVPLAMTTTVAVPVVMPSATIKVVGPSEIPNTPSTGNSNKNAHALKAMTRPISILRRGVGFRQADYGVKPNVTSFDNALRPVSGVEASPSSAAAAAAHSRRWKSYSEYGSDNLDASPNDLAKVEASPSPVTAAPEASALSGDVSDANSGDHPSTSSISVSKLIGLGEVSNTDANHIPINPDFSEASRSATEPLHEAAVGRYQASYGAHQVLADTMPNSAKEMPSAADIEKADYKLDHSVHRRVLAPASYLTTSAPVRRMKQLARDLVEFVARHTFELNTNPLLPAAPNPNLNMSDPDVAREQARQKNIGVFNIDSNQEPKKLKPKLPPSASLNDTQPQVDTTTGNATKAV
ncbi:hypothetical protein L226DRAFT_558571 [Lentinus tigrinus ALCF2SS1-7]|uniref:Uncharacterized protein n=1 Tax=Lentinus tigrinus ALCF2SS1-6 TaxID=1328759 RepID=A0A5C2S3Y8_9APHY|nr:hypothetical protein L227DRAFT_655436 [Lentinus tigrinus ALCF2SS1-6]RPD78791.1 hypothetical protein L226DRAFT_558571 [Lentinus tigrinus ALCF2SS1-7]